MCPTNVMQLSDVNLITPPYSGVLRDICVECDVERLNITMVLHSHCESSQISLTNTFTVFRTFKTARHPMRIYFQLIHVNNIKKDDKTIQWFTYGCHNAMPIRLSIFTFFEIITSKAFCLNYNVSETKTKAQLNVVSGGCKVR